MVGMMSFHTRRCFAEFFHQLLVNQEAFHQRSDFIIFDSQQHLTQFRQQLLDILRRLRLEISRIQVFCRNWLNVGQNHLQGSLEQMHFAFRLHIVARLKMLHPLFDNIPHPGIDHTSRVPQVN